MLEIVFSEIAANGLISAQHVGEGAYPGQPERSVLTGDGWPRLSGSRDSNPNQYEEEARRRWESATPLGGSFTDVFCFPDDYSIGPIVGWGWAQPSARVAALETVFAGARSRPARVQRAAEIASDNFSRLLGRLQEEEDVQLRIWSSLGPREYCGACWLLETIRTRLGRLPDIRIVLLPSAVQAGETWTVYSGWESVSPEEYSDLQRFTMTQSSDHALLMAREWQRMEKQNGSLRTVVNGTLVTVPVSFYDIFIETAAARIAGEFRENDLVHDVLEQSDIGISEEWITFRIDTMLADGRLAAVATAGDTVALYSRMLAKGPAFPYDAGTGRPPELVRGLR